MLEEVVGMLKPGFEAAAAISAAAACLRMLSTPEGHLASRPSRLKPLWIALAFTATAGVVCAYLLSLGVLQREPFDGLTKLAASFGALVLISLLWSKSYNQSLAKVLVLASISALLLPRTAELAVLPTTLLGQVGVINTELLSKITGMLWGILASVLFGTFLIRKSKAIGIFQLLSISAVLTILLAAQAVAIAQFAFAYGFLPLTPSLLSILAPLINNYAYFFYGLLAACSLTLLANIFTQRTRKIDTFANSAERRKHKAARRAEKRVAFAMLLSLLTTGALVAGQSIAATYQKRASELSSAEIVEAKEGEAVIPLKEISDGSLYRFSFQASDGAKVRFIVVHKGSGVYGVGLDFCDICGPTGYYQRGQDVVCKNCDVVINIPTIGIPGGCNPVPLNHTVSGKTLVIAVSDLEGAKQKFR